MIFEGRAVLVTKRPKCFLTQQRLGGKTLKF